MSAQASPALLEARRTADAIPRARSQGEKRMLQRRLLAQLRCMTTGKDAGRQLRLA